MTKVKILSMKFKTAMDYGLEDIVGQTLELRGNAWSGFNVALPNGDLRWIGYYHVSFIKDPTNEEIEKICLELLGITPVDGGFVDNEEWLKRFYNDDIREAVYSWADKYDLVIIPQKGEP